MHKKNIWRYLFLAILLFIVGFSLTSGLLSKFADYALNEIAEKSELYFIAEFNKIDSYPDVTYYLLLPPKKYSEFYASGLSPAILCTMLINVLFNFLFQPVFLCALTPQVILTVLLFPFFIWGVIKYFKKVPIMILVFFCIALFVGLNGTIVERLIRHRLSCELMYLLLGLAGLVSWTTEKLY